jgi:tetratricopeptide (TPR) repeat protein
VEDEAIDLKDVRHLRLRVSVASLAVLAVVVVAGAADRPWTLLRSEHLTVIGQQSPQTLQRIAVDLEQFRAVVGRLIQGAERPLPLPTHVYVFNSARELQPFQPVRGGRVASLGGYFHHDGEVNAIALAIDGYGESTPVVFHEYAHLLVLNAARSVPVWLNEGLAEYYSTYALEAAGTRAQIGRPIAHHVALLRERFMPLPQLIAVDTQSALYGEAQRRSIFYAEAWALTHYLMIERADGPAAINAYAAAIARGEPPESAFKSAFGSAPSEFERELRRYVRQPKFRSIALTLSQPIAVETPDRGRAVSAEEAAAWLGDLQRRIGRRDEARARIERAAAASPSSPMAQLALGLLRVDEGRADDAWAAFERAVASAPENFLAQFSYGVSRLREQAAAADGLPSSPMAIARARDAVAKAAAIDPSSSEAFAWLAYAEMMSDNRLREAQAAIARAIDLAPGRVDYRLRYADICILDGRIDEASALLTALARVKTDRAGVEGATRRLAAIAALRK